MKAKKDPATTVCTIAVEPTADEAIDSAIAKFDEQVKKDGADYYFSAVDVKIAVIQELAGQSVVVELWYERIPR